MFEQEIDRQLLPNIKLNRSNKYFRYEGKATPLEQAFNFIGKDKSLYLCASGGIGKTTSLRTLWLDFLAGKHDIPCLYVDLKLLGADKGNRAIWDYINDKNKYNLNLDNIDNDSIKPVLLLDAANEAPYLLLETENNKDCFLLQECKTLINDGFRLLISSRAPFIVKEGEFGGDMECCELCGLTDDQIKIAVKDESIYNTPLWDLLQNNIMLSMYLHSESWDIETDKDITAYGLLNHYFEKCFKAQYVQATLKLDEDKKKLYATIKDIEEPVKPKVRLKWTETQIKEKLDEYKEAKNYLSAHGDKNIFYESEMPLDVKFLAALTHLGILQKITNDNNSTGSGRYVWGHEIYQEYFESIYLANQIREILKKHYSFNEASKIFYRLGSYGFEEHDYKTIQYAAEQSKFEKEDIDYLYDLVETNESGVVKSNILRGVILLSCFSGLDFPDKQTSVESSIFFNCKTLKSIKIPSNITKVEAYAFRGCAALESVELPDTIECIEEKAFSGCRALKNINFPDKIVFIGAYAFEDCVKLSNIVLPQLLEHLDCDAFSGCSSLSEIYIPKSMKYLGIGVFRKCSSLKKVTLANNLQIKHMSTDLFKECEKLEEIKLPENIKYIGDFAFYGCKALRQIDMPESLETIGRAAFAGCPIKEVVLPKSVRSIGSGAFDFFYLCERNSEWVDTFVYAEADYTVKEEMPKPKGVCEKKFKKYNFLKKVVFSDLNGWVIVFGNTNRGYYFDWYQDEKKYGLFLLFNKYKRRSKNKYRQKDLRLCPHNDSVSVNRIYYDEDDYARCQISHRIPHTPTGPSFCGNFVFEPKGPVELFKISSNILADPQTAAKFLAYQYCNYQWIKID